MSKIQSVLFIMNSFSTGGAEKSLVNLLNNFDYKKFQVTLALINYSGDLGLILWKFILMHYAKVKCGFRSDVF